MKKKKTIKKHLKKRRSTEISKDALSYYLKEIRRYPILSEEEEKRLAELYRKKGDKDAAYKLFLSNMRLVVKIALEYKQAYRNLLDIIQEGNIGLLKAIEKYDPSKGVKLSSYASWWIRAYILRFIINNWGLVKVGTTQAQRKLFYNLQKEKRRLELEGFKPTYALIASRLNVKEEEVKEMDKRLKGGDVSLDTPLKESSSGTHLDFIVDDKANVVEQVVENEKDDLLKKYINDFKETLSNEKERFILEHRLLGEEHMTLEEIGSIFGVTRERIRQLEVRVKKKLKNYLVDKFGKDQITDFIS